ncbi:MAG TPA: hypothetical protein VFC93_02565 [Chloroflexota bacterium]|jgi:hypothetical protein|nr:hypothetical protein [Chloroflexota bacterium]
MLPLIGPLGAVARWALSSKALFGLLVALATVVVITAGTVLGAAIAARNAVEAAPAAGQSAASKPNAAAAPTLGPPRAVGVGTVVSVGADEMLVKPRAANQPPERVAMMPNGVVWKHGKRVPFAEVHPSDVVFVFGRVDRAKREVAARIVVVDPPRPLRPRAAMLDSASEVSPSRV